MPKREEWRGGGEEGGGAELETSTKFNLAWHCGKLPGDKIFRRLRVKGGGKYSQKISQKYPKNVTKSKEGGSVLSSEFKHRMYAHAFRFSTHKTYHIRPCTNDAVGRCMVLAVVWCGRHIWYDAMPNILFDCALSVITFCKYVHYKVTFQVQRM